MERAVRPWLLRGLPNVLSTLRLGLAVAMPLAPPARWAPIIFTAGLSDWLDGYLARRFGTASWLGGLLDSVADKAFVLSAILTLALNGRLDPWWAPLLLTRDAVVFAGVAQSALRRDRDAFRDMESRTLGKLTTAAIFAFLLSTLLFPEAAALHRAVFVAAAVASFGAAIDYARKRWRPVNARPG